MSKVLIAFNNDYNTDLHNFFQSCADEVKQICHNNGIEFSPVCPPNLSEQNVIDVMTEHQLCFFAGHGDADGIYNENEEPIVSIHTTNHKFKNKGFYSIACSCAQKLHPELTGKGIKFFVGYNSSFNVRGELTPFIDTAMAGLVNFLNGDKLKVAKEKMIAMYDQQINKLDSTDPMTAVELLHNKEALIFAGNDDLKFSDLE